eukprot:361033-Chlamydomonas_euryale.AAC.3
MMTVHALQARAKAAQTFVPWACCAWEGRDRRGAAVEWVRGGKQRRKRLRGEKLADTFGAHALNLFQM